MSSAAAARVEKSIGLLMFDDQARFTRAREGILEELGRAGYSEPATRFFIECAKGQRSNLGPAIDRLSAQKVDLLMPIGSPAAIAVAKAFKTIPVVFSLVWDPVDSKIVDSWASSGNNVTGSSPYVPMGELVRRLTASFPVKKMLVVYTPGERQTELNLEALQALEGGSIEVIPFSLGPDEDEARIPDAVKTVDCVFLTPLLAHKVDPIIGAAIEARVLTVSSTEQFAANGALWSLAVDPFVMGRMAGEKAAAVLGGRAPSSIPSEYPTRLDLVINMTTAKRMSLTIPDGVIAAASRVVY